MTQHFSERKSYLDSYKKLEILLFGGQLYCDWSVFYLAWDKYPPTAQTQWQEPGVMVVLIDNPLHRFMELTWHMRMGLCESFSCPSFLNPLSRIITAQVLILTYQRKELLKNKNMGSRRMASMDSELTITIQYWVVKQPHFNWFCGSRLRAGFAWLSVWLRVVEVLRALSRAHSVCGLVLRAEASPHTCLTQWCPFCEACYCLHEFS